MAYMSQEKKQQIRAALKLCIPKTWKWSLGVRNHSTIVLNIASAPVDFLGMAQEHNDREAGRKGTQPYRVGESLDLNPYWWKEQFPEIIDVLTPIFAALNDGNWDKSDIQSDYFNVGWYVDVNVGKWNKPFVYTGE